MRRPVTATGLRRSPSGRHVRRDRPAVAADLVRLEHERARLGHMAEGLHRQLTATVRALEATDDRIRRLNRILADTLGSPTP